MTLRHRILFVFCAASVGCVFQPDYVSRRDATNQTIDEALTEFREGRAQEAFELFTQALESGGVGRDRLYEVCRHRAICAAKLGDLKTTEIDLLTMEEVAPSLADVLLVRSYVLQQQGDTSRAKAAFIRAKRLNGNIEQITY